MTYCVWLFSLGALISFGAPIVIRPAIRPARIPQLAKAIVVSGWSRCICRRLGGMELKIYFDHFSHSSGTQRGWTTCTLEHHKPCIKYEFTTIATDIRTFCARLYLWHERGDDFATTGEHLEYAPTLEAVNMLSELLELRDV